MMVSNDNGDTDNADDNIVIMAKTMMMMIANVMYNE